MPDLIISFQNDAEVTFQLVQTGFDNPEDPHIVHPSAPILAPGDTQYITMNNSTSAREGKVSLSLVWYNPSNAIRFGVQINAGTQFSGMENRPAWNVMFDVSQNMNAPIDWSPSGSDPSEGYTWPASAGYTIVATPTSTHETLSVAVQIASY